MLSRYQKTRKHTLAIVKPLCIEDFVCQPTDFVSPPKWHLAHTTWFFEVIILKEFTINYKPYHPQFNFLYNSYYKSVGSFIPQPQRGALSRPTVTDIIAYRSYVDVQMEKLLDPANSPSKKLLNLATIGLNHEEQHQELLWTDIKYILGKNPLKPAYQKNEKSIENPQNQLSKPTEWISITKNLYWIGANKQHFSYDCENPQHQVFLNDYQIKSQLITNAEYLKFIQDKGYHRHELWLSEGMKWVQEKHIQAPLYWEKISQEWYHYTLAGMQKIDLSKPVCHISFYEADAFCKWKGNSFRLPTEFEWETACRQVGSSFSWGTLWEWTSSAYRPYPGYQELDGTLSEYNGKFMMNQMVLKGASTATTPKHSRPSYRNYFSAETQWQLTGIRLIQISS